MTLRFGILVASLAVLGLASCSPSSTEPEEATVSIAVLPALTGTENFRVLVAGTDIGGLDVTHSADKTLIDYEYRNNGRGPTMREEITLNENGIPMSWNIEGATTFGNKVSENYAVKDALATWTDATGTGELNLKEPTLYVAQDASPYSLWLYARILLADADHSMPVIPGGTLSLERIEDINLANASGTVTSYALSGIDLNPTYIILGSDESFAGMVTPRFSILRDNLVSQDQTLRDRAVEYAAKRFETIQAEVANNYEGPVRIKNIRVFDPNALALSEPASVVFEGNKITAIEAANASSEGETVIDGAGGTLVAGLYEMHAHLGQNSALLNIAAGITTVRDMGNSNEVLSGLIDKIESGRLAGPRVIRSGFIEGKSPFSSNNGELVSTQEEAIAAVKRYANGEFHQIKIYNSMKGEWVPDMIKEARKHGLKVTGHVPAFSNVDQMIAAGYDEMTHINQVMLGWVLDEGEDTRSLLRLTALKRLPSLSMDDPRVKVTIKAMADNGTAIDPTLAIHEALLRSRNGKTQVGVVDYIENMPVGVQRNAKTAWSDISSAEDDTAYYQAFDKIIETVTAMRKAGIKLVPGTDLGGSFTYHRELELYQQVGMSAPEILAWASYGMADYVGQTETLGSIKPGKLADFFLVPGDPTEDLKAIKKISMVVKDGTVYFPSEIYPAFGIKPFVDAPKVTQ